MEKQITMKEKFWSSYNWNLSSSYWNKNDTGGLLNGGVRANWLKFFFSYANVCAAVFIIYPENFKMHYLRYISMLLVVLGGLHWKEGLLFMDLSMLLTQREDGNGFHNATSFYSTCGTHCHKVYILAEHRNIFICEISLVCGCCRLEKYRMVKNKRFRTYRRKLCTQISGHYAIGQTIKVICIQLCPHIYMYLTYAQCSLMQSAISTYISPLGS